MGGPARAPGGCRAQTGADRRDFVARDAQLHGEHAAARHRFGEHGAIARSARTAARHTAGGVCELVAGCGTPTTWRAKSVAGRGSWRRAAEASVRSTQANLHASMERMAERAAAS